MWRRFIITFISAFGAGFGASVLFILLLDPYGNSLLGLPFREPILEINQRYVYPQIVRRGPYDSFVIGTSTSRLLEPQRLNTALGGNFANLAMDDARAWEQTQMMKLILRDAGPPERLLIGLDSVWCREDADTHLTSKRREFPAWLYDANRFNDFLYMLNVSTLELAYKKLRYQFGRNVERYEANGYKDFTQGEAYYDFKRAKRRIQARSKNARLPTDAAFAAIPGQHWRLPALAWLNEILAEVDGKSRVYLIFMPVHVAAQPIRGTQDAAREDECKRRIQEFASRYDALYVDYRVPSSITTNDQNYWDPLHWRIHVGHQLVDELGAKVSTGGDDGRVVSNR